MHINGGAFACSCGGGGTPCQSYGGASAVFIGTVIAVKSVEPSTDKAVERSKTEWVAPRSFKFVVEQSFLGVQGITVEVGTGIGGGDCGYDFKMGERYIVYAHRYDESNRLTTSICTRTKLLPKADEDLQFLRNLSSSAPGVTIYGEIKRQRANIAKGDMTPLGPLADAALIVEGESERREIRTDEQGRYRLSGLGPGKLKVTLSLPDELTTYKPEQEVTIADRGCAVVNYYVVDNGRISGRVFDPQGQPVSRLLVTLVEAESPDPVKSYNNLERVDDEGRYSFTSLPPGRYLIAVNLTRFPETDDLTNAYPRTYYPGVAEISKAEVISLGAGENLREKDLRLPPRRAPSVINGQVVWADGQPVVNAGIMFRDLTYHDPGMNYGMQADEHGYFTIKGYVGQTFVIEARSDRPYVGDPRRFEPMEQVEPVRIALAGPSEVVRIVITKLR